MTQEYSVNLKCCNCKKQNWNIKIPIGTTVAEFGEQENKICDRCGCSIIKVREKKK